MKHSDQWLNRFLSPHLDALLGKRVKKISLTELVCFANLLIEQCRDQRRPWLGPEGIVERLKKQSFKVERLLLSPTQTKFDGEATMTALELDQMEDLTRRYAKHSQGAAGLGAILGGLAFLFQGGLLFGYALGYFLRHGCDGPTRSVWMFFLRSELTPPLVLQLLLVSIPLVWWAARFKLHRWATAAYGEVQQTRMGFRKSYARMDYLGSLAAGPALLIFFSIWKGVKGHPATWTPFFLGAVLLLLAPWVAWTQRRSHSCEDLEAGQMVFLGGAAALNYGIGIAVALMVPAFLVLAIIYIALGLWHHLQFRKVRAELAALPVPE